MSRHAPIGCTIRFGEQIAGAINWDLGAFIDHRRVQAPFPKRIDGRRLSRVIKFVSENIAGNITVADLAGAACMSPAHFARSFKLTTGQCPHEFVNQIRLALAKQMLANRHLSISDIALSTGFSSQSNFSRAFRGATGMTPRGFRGQLSSF
jgi:AraC family transcriptional regulator